MNEINGLNKTLEASLRLARSAYPLYTSAMLLRSFVRQVRHALLTPWVAGMVVVTSAALMASVAQAEPKTKAAPSGSTSASTTAPAQAPYQANPPAQAQNALPAEEPQAIPSDELDKLLADKGLLGKITRVGQQVTQTVSSGASKVSSKASELVVSAMGAIGVPYRRGGSTFDGFDCSGFVRAMVEQTAGLILPRKAEQQAAATQKIDKKDLQPGDLVFFNTMRRAFSHVGIYLGDGKFIHSPKPGAEVRVEDMGQPYWTRRFDGARRVQDGAE